MVMKAKAASAAVVFQPAPLRKRMARYKAYYLLVLPGILYFVIWHYLPMFGIIIAFKDVSPYGGLMEMLTSEWVGLEHFQKFFNSYYFWNVLRNTLNISVQKLIFGFPAPIILALLLNEITHVHYKRVVQTISYLPHFISSVIMAGLMYNVLSTNGGIVNEVIKLFGGQPVFFLGESKYFVQTLVVSSIWQGVGWGSIIYLAAITGIDSQLYEAARIDGANKWQQMVHITLPGVLGVASIMLIMNLGNILNAGFEQILLLYSPSVYDVADIIDTYVYREGLINLNYSYSSAVGLFKSVIGLILVLSVNWIVKKSGQTGIW